MIQKHYGKTSSLEIRGKGIVKKVLHCLTSTKDSEDELRLQVGTNLPRKVLLIPQLTAPRVSIISCTLNPYSFPPWTHILFPSYRKDLGRLEEQEFLNTKDATKVQTPQTWRKLVPFDLMPD